MFRLVSTFRFWVTKIKPMSIQQIPTLKEFMASQHKLNNLPESENILNFSQYKNSYYIETYGCQMNNSDSQLIRSLLKQNYTETNEKDAQIVMLNTCAIRDSAQQKIYQRVNQLKKSKIIAVLGCMAERVKQKMMQKGVHIVCGPDSYRELPKLIQLAKSGNSAIDVQLSIQQTYGQITPIRKNPNSVQAYISIMRGCNNMCSFCIVPFVRGRQRSRNFDSIIKQIGELSKQGVKQITFLGQNVNSYHDSNNDQIEIDHKNTEEFQETYKIRSGPGPRFAQLLDTAASTFPEIRFRFTSPHPKDFPDQVIDVMAKHHNICKYIHLPAQSGNNNVLKRMRRNHTRQAYLKLVRKLKERLPGLTLSTDLISGFCGQTQQQFEDTIALLKQVKYEMAFLFSYSMRPKTHAHRNYQDNVPQDIKQKRLQRMIDTFREQLPKINQKQIGKYHLLLIEGKSKRDAQKLVGKTDTFKKGFISNIAIPTISNLEQLQNLSQQYFKQQIKPGDYILVKVNQVTPRSLHCQPLAKMSLVNFSRMKITR